MSFFPLQKPILQKKQLCLSEAEFNTLKCINLNLDPKFHIPLYGIYTCIDQAMAIWGLISAIIFISAQFLAINWLSQAIIWSIITLFGIFTTVTLTHCWVKSEGLLWLLYLWVTLMMIGMVMTDLAIACGWGIILGNLCNLWLIISAIGYSLTGLGIRSRAFLLSGILHILSVLILPLFIEWEFLFTGLVMATNLFIFSEKQWDMLLPKELNNYSLPMVLPKKLSFHLF